MTFARAEPRQPPERPHPRRLAAPPSPRSWRSRCSSRCSLAAAPAAAAPEAHILRIDPRASMVDGAPVLTTVLEIVQNKRMSDVTGTCATLTGDAALDCIANALEQPGALYSSFDFPEKNALFTVTVDGADLPARVRVQGALGRERRQAGRGHGVAHPGRRRRLDGPPLRRGQARRRRRSSTPWARTTSST